MVYSHVLEVQTGLGDPSSDVPSSSTSVMVLTGTDLPNVFLLPCSVIPMSASDVPLFCHVVRLRHQISVKKGLINA